VVVVVSVLAMTHGYPPCKIYYRRFWFKSSTLWIQPQQTTFKKTCKNGVLHTKNIPLKTGEYHTMCKMPVLKGQIKEECRFFHTFLTLQKPSRKANTWPTFVFFSKKKKKTLHHRGYMKPIFPSSHALLRRESVFCSNIRTYYARSFIGDEYYVSSLLIRVYKPSFLRIEYVPCLPHWADFITPCKNTTLGA
jgi:hypothetical protein